MDPKVKEALDELRTELNEVIERANSAIAQLQAIEEESVEMEKVDARELTPMGMVVESYKDMTEYDFINWFSQYYENLLEREREMVEKIHNTIDTTICNTSVYFDSHFKQTP